MFSRCKQGTDLLYHHAKFGGARISRATRGQKSSMFLLVFCVFCLSVTLSNNKDCERHFAVNAWNSETTLVSLDRGVFVHVQLCTPVQLCLCNAGQSHHRMTKLKKGKSEDFRFSGGDEKHRIGKNLAGKCTSCVYSSKSKSARIGLDSRGVGGTGAPNISNVGHFCVVTWSARWPIRLARRPRV